MHRWSTSYSFKFLQVGQRDEWMNERGYTSKRGTAATLNDKQALLSWFIWEPEALRSLSLFLLRWFHAKIFTAPEKKGNYLAFTQSFGIIACRVLCLCLMFHDVLPFLFCLTKSIPFLHEIQLLLLSTQYLKKLLIGRSYHFPVIHHFNP